MPPKKTNAAGYNVLCTRVNDELIEKVKLRKGIKSTSTYLKELIEQDIKLSATRGN